MTKASWSEMPSSWRYHLCNLSSLRTWQGGAKIIAPFFLSIYAFCTRAVSQQRVKLRETRCVRYRGTRGGKREEGPARGKSRTGGKGRKGPAKGGKARPKSRRRGEGGKLQVYMLEHASHPTRIVNSCGQCTLRVRATEKYLAPGLTKVPRDRAI